MTEAEVEHASGAELACYRELAAAYAAMAAALADEHTPVPADALAAAQARADAASVELRRLATSLAPHRLGGEPVPSRVQALWQASAALAAEAALANAALVRAARARQTVVAGQLARLGTGRRALGAYRPAPRTPVRTGLSA
jgi:hypothetical protein